MYRGPKEEAMPKYPFRERHFSDVIKVDDKAIHADRPQPKSETCMTAPPETIPEELVSTIVEQVRIQLSRARFDTAIDIINRYRNSHDLSKKRPIDFTLEEKLEIGIADLFSYRIGEKLESAGIHTLGKLHEYSELHGLDKLKSIRSFGVKMLKEVYDTYNEWGPYSEEEIRLQRLIQRDRDATSIKTTTKLTEHNSNGAYDD